MTREELEKLEVLKIILKSENIRGSIVDKVVNGTYVFYRGNQCWVKGKDMEEGLLTILEGVFFLNKKTIRFENAYNQGYISTGEAKKFLSQKNPNK